MPLRGVAIGLVALLALAPPSASADTHVARTVYANLDADTHVERVQVVHGTRPNPYGGTDPLPVAWVQVRDVVRGRHVTVRISRRVWHIPSRWVKVTDATADGGPEVWWRGWVGENGAVPFYAGLLHWRGASAHVLWHYLPRNFLGYHNGHAFYYAGANARLASLASANTPGLEIQQMVGARRKTQPTCCPSYEKISLWRYRESAGGYVRYAVIWKRLS